MSGDLHEKQIKTIKQSIQQTNKQTIKQTRTHTHTAEGQ